MNAASVVPVLLAIAWLLPLVSFAVISLGYSVPQLVGTRASYASAKYAAYIAIGAIGIGFLLSLVALFGYWLPAHPLTTASHHEGHTAGEQHVGAGGEREVHGAEGEVPHDGDEHSAADHRSTPFHFAAFQQAEESTEESHAHENNDPPPYYAGDWYELGVFGKLKLTIGYYIDSLTVAMFCMVTLIATCVHVYAVGYMHDELHDFTDHEVTLENGSHLHRPGRFYRFFQYLSLFSFSMLGVVIAGNLAMVFVFWELVGICSYFLIGFYIERQSASTAANKAFIVNRVGDFGMLIGLMAIWSSLGTFNFGDIKHEDGSVEQGIFSMLRSEENDYRLLPADGMVASAARDQIAAVVVGQDTDAAAAAAAATVEALRQDTVQKYGHWLLFVAGVGLFCGCVGKSAQFPLHVWLPDAMEGPTPVSALVHSATMVAAGVYLVGRAYPIFTPEALLVIAIVGAITLFLAATIAITATDIKRVLAYSTVSQLGYMMLALGLGGFVAGMLHLITHAFFKGLLFLCSGSVIHAVHTNEMTEMGGLLKKMPVTAITMLIGCLAIIGAGVPVLHFGYVGLSGFFSKDAIIEQALSHAQRNDAPWMWLLFLLPVLGAAITAFYMFRLWFMTFAGEPRDHHRYEHAHESPHVMTVPLIALAVFAVCITWQVPFTNVSVVNVLEQGRPVGTLATATGTLIPDLIVPSEHDSHEPEIAIPAGLTAFCMAAFGLILATIIYLWKHVDPATLKTALRPLYELSWHKWWFDELYDFVFVKPTLVIGAIVARIDLGVIDSIIHACAWTCRGMSLVVDVVGDRAIIDRSVDGLADWTWRRALSLRSVQTGHVRQYVMFIVIATVVLFVAAGLWRFAVAG